jgi:hypothetical protein
MPSETHPDPPVLIRAVLLSYPKMAALGSDPLCQMPLLCGEAVITCLAGLHCEPAQHPPDAHQSREGQLVPGVWCAGFQSPHLPTVMS